MDEGSKQQNFTNYIKPISSNKEQINLGELKGKNILSRDEVDFIIKLRGQEPIAIECKWKEAEFNIKGILKFREIHTKGINLVISSDTTTTRTKKHNELTVTYCSLKNLKELR